MRIVGALLRRLSWNWIEWRTARARPIGALTPEQRAVLVRQAWTLPPRYRVTQPANRALAWHLWRRHADWYYLRHREAWQGPVSSAGPARVALHPRCSSLSVRSIPRIA